MQAVHFACSKNQPNVLALLIDKGADKNSRSFDGSTPLIIATRFRALDCVDWLLKHEANVEIPRNDQWKPIHVASHIGNKDILLKLIEGGAKVNPITGSGDTALHIAVSNENTCRLETLLVEGKADFTQLDQSGWEPLHLSSYQGYHDGVQTLIDNKAPVDSFSSTLLTPLHLACQEGHMDCVLLLLSRDANVNLAGEDGLTALHIACFFHQKDIIKILLDHEADVNVKSHSGSTPLLVSTQAGDLDAIQLLLSNGADISLAKDGGWTPLHAAAYGLSNLGDVSTVDIDKKCAKIIGVLLEDSKGSVAKNIMDKEQRSSVFVATERGRINCVQTLLEEQVDLTLMDKRGWMPLHAAIDSRYQ